MCVCAFLTIPHDTQTRTCRNYLRLASRIDAVAGRVETAVRMRMVTKSMGGIVKNLEAASKSMNLEKVLLLHHLLSFFFYTYC